jgi:ABC-type Fe3+ transport system permease subunit
MKLRIILITGFLLGIAISALEFVKMFAEQLDYDHFLKIAALFFLILIIAALYWGLKEIKERCYEENQILKFSKAFFYGCCISLVAFIAIFIYLIIHYSYIDVEGLQRISEKNSALPSLTNVASASLMFALIDLLYAIFLNLFVAIYITSNKRTEN